MDESLKSLLSVETPDVGSHESDVKPVITIAGKYLFAILSVKAGDSREFGNGETKQFVPENYNDSTPEVLLVLKDVESEERWFEHFAIRAFRKFDGLTQAEVKALKPLNVRKDERDNYAIINDPVTKEPRRLVAQSGTAEHTGLMRIWSNLCGAAGLPLGTKFSEFEQLKGKSFWGTLQKREYMGRDRETGEMVKKTGLKLLPNFFPPSDSERSAIEELASVTEEFVENV